MCVCVCAMASVSYFRLILSTYQLFMNIEKYNYRLWIVQTLALGTYVGKVWNRWTTNINIWIRFGLTNCIGVIMKPNRIFLQAVTKQIALCNVCVGESFMKIFNRKFSDNREKSERRKNVQKTSKGFRTSL